MKPSDRLELDDLRAHQRILRREMEALEKRIERLVMSVDAPEPVAPAPVVMEEVKAPLPPLGIAVPPPLPVMTQAPPPIEKPPVVPAAPRAEAAPVSFEQKVGAFWLVRIGVVLLLTGFVFLGNYAYHHVIAKFGPMPKVALLYLAGGALAGAGLWLERGEEKMRNFSRVLIAGGLAEIYYTTYAAHFVANLRVIASPLLGGAALLALAGGIAWFADRRKSETIALLVVLLSYYTAAINPVAGFSLFSNLLLTALAVFFLARHRWTNISYAALVATYASFGYWRFYHTGNLIIPSQLAPADFWSQSEFLFGYWALFTVAVFLSRAEAFTPMQRTPFLTANNAAFFGLVAPTIGVVYPGAFGTCAGIFGAVLLALSLLARRVRGDDLFMDGAYLAQGIALVTIGIAAKFTGYQLALALAIESAVLLEMSRFRHGLLYKIGACLCALGAFIFAGELFTTGRGLIVPLASTLALVFAASAWRYKQSRGELAEPSFQWFPAGFITLALLMGLVALSEWTRSASNFPPSLGLAAVVCVASLHLLRLPEIAILGQGYLLLANFSWFAMPHRDEAPTANTAIVMAATLAVMHWWPRQRVMSLGKAARKVIGLPYAAAVAAVLYVWVSPKFSDPVWMAVSGGLALLVLVYGLATRAWWLAAFGQVFTAASVFGFFAHLVNAQGPWPLAFERMPLGAMALLGIQAAAGTLLASRLPDDARAPVALLAKAYRIVLTAMTFAWCVAYLPKPAQFCAIMLLALAFFAVAALAKRPGAMLHAAALTVGGLCAVWVWKFVHGEVFGADMAGVLILLAMQQAARRLKMNAPIFPADAHPVVILAGMATLWLQVTHFAARSEHGLLLTIAWSLLAFAVLGGGFFLRERLYRQLALALFGLAIGRIFVIDVWKFETIYRIASFIVLGVMLIVVSFVYNRYGDRLRTLL